MVKVTEMLRRWSDGDQEAFDLLAPVVYRELKRLAHARLRSGDERHTLNTTGLVHEAYMRLVDVDQVEWSDRGHFFAMASRTMRRILVEQARKRATVKRDRGARVDLEAVQLVGDAGYANRLLRLDDALDSLEAEHPRQAKVVELVCFGGLKQQDVGAALSISQPTVARDLQFARAWLARAWGAD